MEKIYYLSTCDTCRKIMSEIPGFINFELQDIKSIPITESQLEQLKDKTGSFESLFSKRAIKYKEWDLKSKGLTDADYRALILEEYTFLKRPVVVVDDKVFAGSEKKTVQQLQDFMSTRTKQEKTEAGTK